MAMSEGVYSTEDIQKQCEENINYIWLLQGYSSPRHMRFQRFFCSLFLKGDYEFIYTSNGSHCKRRYS